MYDSYVSQVPLWLCVGLTQMLVGASFIPTRTHDSSASCLEAQQLHETITRASRVEISVHLHFTESEVVTLNTPSNNLK